MVAAHVWALLHWHRNTFPQPLGNAGEWLKFVIFPELLYLTRNVLTNEVENHVGTNFVNLNPTVRL